MNFSVGIDEFSASWVAVSVYAEKLLNPPDLLIDGRQSILRPMDVQVSRGFAVIDDVGLTWDLDT